MSHSDSKDKAKTIFEEADITQTKQILQVLLLAYILLCKNAQWSMLMHALVTELTICHGGKQELVKILNQIRVSALIDTS